MSRRIRGWHFLQPDRRMLDGNVAAPGYVYSVEGPLRLCDWGLHASRRAIDALGYAPGPVVGRVEQWGDIIHGGDKYVARHREYLWITDASEVLRGYARWCASEVLHLWKEPVPQVVMDWLATGDELLRDAARRVSWRAAESATDSAARRAALSATDSAGQSATWIAAWDAGWSAAISTAERATRSTTWSTWSAAREKQNAELERRLMELAP